MKPDSKIGVYCITNAVDGKMYIGSSRNLPKRKWEHFHRLRLGRHENPKLMHAFKRYGEINFTFSVVEICDSKNLLVREQWWLDMFIPFEDKGYNIARTAGAATLGIPRSSETKRKISESLKSKRIKRPYRPWTPEKRAAMLVAMTGRKYPNRKRVSMEGRRRMSEALRGIHRTDEWKRKIGDANRGKKRTPEQIKQMRGRKLTPEHIERLRQSHCKYIYDGLLSPDGTMYFGIRNLRAFCIDKGINPGNMASVICGKRKSANGWVYVRGDE